MTHTLTFIAGIGIGALCASIITIWLLSIAARKLNATSREFNEDTVKLMRERNTTDKLIHVCLTEIRDAIISK